MEIVSLGWVSALTTEPRIKENAGKERNELSEQAVDNIYRLRYLGQEISTLQERKQCQCPMTSVTYISQD